MILFSGDDLVQCNWLKVYILNETSSRTRYQGWNAKLLECVLVPLRPEEGCVRYAPWVVND